MSSRDDLRRLVDELQATVDTTRTELAKEFPEPAIVRDPSGRYILLDALTVLINAQTALVRAGGD